MKVDKYLKNVTCLYVEDEESIRDVFSVMLRRYFKELYVGTNGEEGYRLFLEKKPDLTISDIRMPVMDGIEMAKKIKEKDPNAYIIFITAFSDTDYLKAALEIGVEGYITKPVEKEKLIKKLNFFAEIFKTKHEKENLYKALKTIFENQPEPLALFNNDNIVISNKKFQEMFGALSFTELTERLNINTSLNEQVIEYENKTLKIRIIRPNDETFLIFINDITSFEEQIQKDKLTGAYNRNILDKFYESLQLLENKLCVIFTDIDKFKNINDTYGHQTGDLVLKEFVAAIKSSLRKEDMIIRYGGEEFLIFLKNVDSDETTSKIAENLRKKIESLSLSGLKFTASFGVCCGYIKSKEDFENLIKKADEALYEAKNSGRNNVKVCK
jgi:diguanylate cyclase (GGDEF)-like protein